ncbi:MAG: Ig-like domain-containing protein [Gemmatirosa sp.]
MPTFLPTSRARTGALASVLIATAACTPLGGPDEDACTGTQCVASIEIAATRRYLLVGDTTRLQGEVLLRNGSATPFTWRAGQPSIVSVNDAGVVTAVARGRGTVAAVPTTDSTVSAFVAFDVVNGDSSAVPYVVAVTDLATRAQIPYGGIVNDSIDVTLEYVVGRLADQAVTSAQLRIFGNGRDTTFTLPTTAAPGTIGRGSARIRFTPPAGSNVRPFPQGYYTAFTVLRLANNRTLAVEIPQLFAVSR